MYVKFSTPNKNRVLFNIDYVKDFQNEASINDL